MPIHHKMLRFEGFLVKMRTQQNTDQERLWQTVGRVLASIVVKEASLLMEWRRHIPGEEQNRTAREGWAKILDASQRGQKILDFARGGANFFRFFQYLPMFLKYIFSLFLSHFSHSNVYWSMGGRKILDS